MQTKSLVTAFLFVGLLVACDNGTEPEDDSVFDAALTGAAEVPAVDTDASGDVDFEWEEPDEELEFVLRVQDIENVTMAHIHFGEAGVSGPIIVTLFQTANPVTVTTSTEIASSQITPDDILAVTGFDGTFDGLIEAIRSGDAYVNVHTQAHPAGEIRGQITEVL